MEDQDEYLSLIAAKLEISNALLDEVVPGTNSKCQAVSLLAFEYMFILHIVHFEHIINPQ